MLYSYSYEPNPNWSRPLPPREELFQYLKTVAEKYDLPPKMTFNVNVDRCEWLEDRSVWRLHMHDRKTGKVHIHECQFLFAASGLLVTPRELDVPGKETFKGPLFHSAEWRHDVDLTDKRVVLFGNGCTATQIVPEIVGKTKHLTQVVRSKHWIYPPSISGAALQQLKFLRNHVPFSMLVQRFIVFLGAEREWRGFGMSAAAARFRKSRRERAEKYIKSLAPEKYHELLIPDFEVGCKRRIFNTGYLECLDADNFVLTDKKVLEIVPEGVRTEDGIIPADVIIAANGFQTANGFMPGIEVIGRDGETAREHWEQFGGAEAYQSSVMSGFPNFFLLLGPNAATGHTSAVMASENSINYALRVIKPVLDGRASAAEIKLEAEQAYVEEIHRDLEKTVWHSGCKSWYVHDLEDGKRWNDQTYPWSQAYYWYRSLFPVWSDWQYSVCPTYLHFPFKQLSTESLTYFPTQRGKDMYQYKPRRTFLALLAMVLSVVLPILFSEQLRLDLLGYIPAIRSNLASVRSRWL